MHLTSDESAHSAAGFAASNALLHDLVDDAVHVDDNDEADIDIVCVGCCGIVVVVVGEKALAQRSLRNIF